MGRRFFLKIVRVHARYWTEKNKFERSETKEICFFGNPVYAKKIRLLNSLRSPPPFNTFWWINEGQLEMLVSVGKRSMGLHTLVVYVFKRSMRPERINYVFRRFDDYNSFRERLRENRVISASLFVARRCHEFNICDGQKSTKKKKLNKTRPFIRRTSHPRSAKRLLLQKKTDSSTIF